MSHETEAKKIAEVAARLHVNPAWLDALINFETGGTYDPMKAGPTSTGARGLIQVIDSTARTTFGYKDSLTLAQEYPDFDSQMENVVYPYLKHYAPFPTQQSLYMAVFYPIYRFVPPTKPFPAEVTAVNPKIRTPQDYINFVNSRLKSATLHFSTVAFSLPLVLLCGWLLYRYLR